MKQTEKIVQTVFPDRPETHISTATGTVISRAAPESPRIPDAIRKTFSESASDTPETRLYEPIAGDTSEAAPAATQESCSALPVLDELIQNVAAGRVDAAPEAPPAAEVEHTDREHHEHSPSSLQAKEVCPGYKSKLGTNAAAELGTFLHECADSGKYDELDDEQLAMIYGYDEYVQGLLSLAGPGAYVIKEEYLPIDDRLPTPTTAGYLDRGVIWGNEEGADIIDLKTGKNPVEPAKNNLQGIAYGLGLLFRFPKLRQFTVHFVCPYIPYADEATGETSVGYIDSHTFYKEEFEGLRLRVVTAVSRAEFATDAFGRFSKTFDASELSGVPLTPTVGCCLFCDRVSICPRVGEFALKASEKYDALQLPDVVNPSLVQTPDQAAAGLKFFGVMEALSRSFRSRMTERTMSSEPGNDWVPTGYKLVVASKRTISDKARFYDTVKPLLTPDELVESMDFTLGPIEKAVSKKAPRGKKKAALQELKLLLRTNGCTKDCAPVPSLRLSKIATPDGGNTEIEIDES